MLIEKRARVAIIVSDKIDFESKKFIRNKEGHILLIYKICSNREYLYT